MQHGLDLAGEHVAAGGDPADHLQGLVGELAAVAAQEDLRVGVDGGEGGLELMRGLQHVPGPLVGGGHEASIGGRQLGVALRKAPARREARNQIDTEISATEPTWVVKTQGAADARPCAAGGAGCHSHIDRAGNAPKLSAVTHDTYIAMAIPVTARLSAEQKKMQTKTM